MIGAQVGPGRMVGGVGAPGKRGAGTSGCGRGARHIARVEMAGVGGGTAVVGTAQGRLRGWRQGWGEQEGNRERAGWGGRGSEGEVMLYTEETVSWMLWVRYGAKPVNKN